MTKYPENVRHAIENAKGWYASIEEMLDAEWKAAAEAKGWTGPHKDKFGATYFEHSEDKAIWACGTWRELCEAQTIDTDTAHCDEARQAIEESVLSVMVRDGWRQPGASTEDGPEEYEILLTTGGPALRIYGRLDQHNQPDTAELQIQDWGTPWTNWAPDPYDEKFSENLLRFAAVFYFGE